MAEHPSDPAPSAELLRQARAGDEAALRLIYERHRTRVFRLARGLLADAAEAEDVMQDVMVYALTHLDRFDPDRAAFATWLHAITVNRCRDRARRQRLGMRRIVDWLAGHQPATEHQLAAALVAVDERDRIGRALASLTERQREALVLRAVEGLSYAELGQVLGVPLRTAQARVRAAVLAMRQALAGEATEEPSETV